MSVWFWSVTILFTTLSHPAIPVWQYGDPDSAWLLIFCVIREAVGTWTLITPSATKAQFVPFEIVPCPIAVPPLLPRNVQLGFVLDPDIVAMFVLFEAQL